MSKYLLDYEKIRDLSIENFVHKLQNLDGIRLKDIRLEDFIFYNGKAIASGRGVYIFKNDIEFYYVGDCTSRSFIERIPSHFDTKCEAWMNIILKHHTLRTMKLPLTNENLASSATTILMNYSLILINFEEHNMLKISNLERLLLSVLNPINKLKKPLKVDIKEKIYCYVEQGS